MKKAKVKLSLPKFTCSSRLDLKSTLSTLGMKDPFVYQTADFTGMADTRELYIDLVLHQAHVNVHEIGTEAAAATMEIMIFGGDRQPSIPINVDRPFLFLIRDNQTGTILFMGRVVDPRGD
jgi:serpin B